MFTRDLCVSLPSLWPQDPEQKSSQPPFIARTSRGFPRHMHVEGMKQLNVLDTRRSGSSQRVHDYTPIPTLDITLTIELVISGCPVSRQMLISYWVLFDIHTYIYIYTHTIIHMYTVRVLCSREIHELRHTVVVKNPQQQRCQQKLFPVGWHWWIWGTIQYFLGGGYHDILGIWMINAHKCWVVDCCRELY